MDASDRPSAPRQRTRRLRRLVATAVLSLTALTGTTAGASADVARPADGFVDSIGINTHLYYNDTDYYQRFDTVSARLHELGVRHIRENLVPNRPDQYERLNRLASQGIRPTLILGEPTDGSAGLNDLVSVLETDLRGTTEAVEGPNEWDLNGGGNWSAELGAYQAMLYSKVRSSGAVRGLPVLGPALGNVTNVGPDVSESAEYGNFHPYPNGEPPEWNIAKRIGEAQRMTGSKPLMATETGYHTAVNTTLPGHQPASEAAAATYLPRLYLEYFRRGIVRTFSYELLDEWNDPNHDEPESNFGLLRNDLSPKPAFTALRNMISILSDPGSSFTPGAIDLAVAGDTRDLNRLLLQKSDGSYYVALWRSDSVWDTRARTAEPAASGKVTLSFGQLLSGAEVYSPSASVQPLEALGATDAVNVDVGADAVIVRVVPSGHAVGRIKAWVSRRAVAPGQKVAVKGKLPAGAGRVRVTIQRWGKGRWRTIGRSVSRPNGRFARRLRIAAPRRGRASRIRVIARRAKPSRPVRVRILEGGKPNSAQVSVSPGRAL